MKLIDVLARELKEWPAGVESLSQLKGTGYIINGKGFDGRAFDSMQLADETRIAGAIVTRAQWQAAVDALKADECEHSHGNEKGCPECGEEFERRWNGEGLPPVGVDALLKKECKLTEGTRLESFPAGTAVYVGGHANFGGCDLAVIIIKGRHFCGTIIPELLERVRTPEQIAADERAAGIQEMRFAAGSLNDYPFVQLWDAGYRKQVAQ